MNAKLCSFSMQKCNEKYNKFPFSPPFNSNCCAERCLRDTKRESLAALKKYVAIGKDSLLFILANVLFLPEKQNNKRRSCNCNNFPSLSFSLLLETILGRSRLGICCYGVGSSLFMAFYNSIAFWHVLNSLRSSSIVS